MEQDSRIYFDKPVTEAKAFSGRKGRQAKEFLEKVAKLVPVEIVGPYKASILFVDGIQPATLHIWGYWGLFVLGFLGTLWYVDWRMGSGFEKWRHLLVYGGAFVVWAYAVSGGHLLPFPYYQDALAGIVLIVASVIFGMVNLPAKEVRS
jgi:hypothetical protein